MTFIFTFTILNLSLFIPDIYTNMLTSFYNTYKHYICTEINFYFCTVTKLLHKIVLLGGSYDSCGVEVQVVCLSLRLVWDKENRYNQKARLISNLKGPAP